MESIPPNPGSIVNPNPEGIRSWDAVKTHPDQWSLISDEDHDYCLGVLPPYYFRGGFAVSEAIRHDEYGFPVYLAIATVNGKHYAREATLRDAAAWAVGLRNVRTAGAA